MSNFSAFKTVLVALFKNKLRFSQGDSKKKKIATLAGFLALYLLLVTYGVIFIVFIGGPMAEYGFAAQLYIMLLLTGALFVLIFGVVSLVSVLYLAKDTDFFSALPIKSSVVFAAKIAFVYISEAALVVAVELPIMITLGVVAKAGAAYYIISILTMSIVPSLPLVLAMLFAVPVMAVASRLKHRNIVSLIFYTVLFLAFFGLYIFFMSSMSSIDPASITPEQLQKYARVLEIIGYVLYPYTALSSAALGVPTFGLGVAASVAVNLLIFIGISAVLTALMLLLGKLTYAKAVKANNQTNIDGAKAGEYKTSSCMKALVKREYSLALRTTSTAFQCFAVAVLPGLIAVMLSLFGFSNMVQAGFMTKDAAALLTAAIVLMLNGSVVTPAVTSISREGMGLATLKMLPVSAKTIVKSKTLAWTGICLAGNIVAAVVLSAFDFVWWRFIIMIVGYSLIAIALVPFSVLWDLMSPKLKWTDPIEAVKRNSHSNLVMFMFMGVMLVVILVSAIIYIVAKVNTTVLYATFWSIVAAIAVAIAVLDALMYKKAENYYNRLEL